MEAEIAQNGLKLVGMGLTALGLLGAGIGVGNVFASAIQGIARNPSAQGKIQVPMYIGMAMAEIMGLLAFVIAMLIFNS